MNRSIGAEMRQGVTEAIVKFCKGPECGFNRMLNLGKSSAWDRDLLLFWREPEGGSGEGRL
jgi:hypothetical protein